MFVVQIQMYEVRKFSHLVRITFGIIHLFMSDSGTPSLRQKSDKISYLYHKRRNP